MVRHAHSLIVKAVLSGLVVLAAVLAGCGNDAEVRAQLSGLDESCAGDKQRLPAVGAKRVGAEEVRIAYHGNSSTPPCALRINVSRDVPSFAAIAANPDVQFDDAILWCLTANLPPEVAEKADDQMDKRGPRADLAVRRFLNRGEDCVEASFVEQVDRAVTRTSK